MKTPTIESNLTINSVKRTLSVSRDESLLNVLRRASYFSVKYGCDDGTCGICTVLLNGKPVHSCKIKAVDAEGKSITTVEALSQDGELAFTLGFSDELSLQVDGQEVYHGENLWQNTPVWCHSRREFHPCSYIHLF